MRFGDRSLILEFETRVRIELLMPRVFVYMLIDVTIEILTQFLIHNEVSNRYC